MNQYGNPVLYGDVTLNIEGENHTVQIIDGVASIFHVFRNMGDVQISAAFERVGFIGSTAQIDETIYPGNDVDYKVNLINWRINNNE